MPYLQELANPEIDDLFAVANTQREEVCNWGFGASAVIHGVEVDTLLGVHREVLEEGAQHYAIGTPPVTEAAEVEMSSSDAQLSDTPPEELERRRERIKHDERLKGKGMWKGKPKWRPPPRPLPSDSSEDEPPPKLNSPTEEAHPPGSVCDSPTEEADLELTDEVIVANKQIQGKVKELTEVGSKLQVESQKRKVRTVALAASIICTYSAQPLESKWENVDGV